MKERLVLYIGKIKQSFVEKEWIVIEGCRVKKWRILSLAKFPKMRHFQARFSAEFREIGTSLFGDSVSYNL